jgi:hypothetical protein
MPDIDPRMRTVASLKSAHLRWRKRSLWALPVGLIVGIVAGLGWWFAVEPRYRDSTLFDGVLALVLGGPIIAAVFTRMLYHMPELKCPQCGHDWWKRSVEIEDWLKWAYCPYCGLKLNDGPLPPITIKDRISVLLKKMGL